MKGPASKDTFTLQTHFPAHAYRFLVKSGLRPSQAVELLVDAATAEGGDRSVSNHFEAQDGVDRLFRASHSVISGWTLAVEIPWQVTDDLIKDAEATWVREQFPA